MTSNKIVSRGQQRHQSV